MVQHYLCCFENNIILLSISHFFYSNYLNNSHKSPFKPARTPLILNSPAPKKEQNRHLKLWENNANGLFDSFIVVLHRWRAVTEVIIWETMFQIIRDGNLLLLFSYLIRRPTWRQMRMLLQLMSLPYSTKMDLMRTRKRRKALTHVHAFSKTMTLILCLFIKNEIQNKERCIHQNLLIKFLYCQTPKKRGKKKSCKKNNFQINLKMNKKKVGKK